MTKRLSEESTVTIGLFLSTLALIVAFAVDYLGTRAKADGAADQVSEVAKDVRKFERSLIRLETEAGIYEPKNWRD